MADKSSRVFARIPCDWKQSDLPAEHLKICRKRTQGIVHGFLVRAAFGNQLDVYALAESCYAQAVEDMVERELMKEKGEPMAETLLYCSARLVRMKEFNHDPVLGSRDRLGLLPGRATLELDCSGDGWKVSASVTNAPVEEKASAQKLVAALRTAINVVEARIVQEGT